jgi:hypothetical protein
MEKNMKKKEFLLSFLVYCLYTVKKMEEIREERSGNRSPFFISLLFYVKCVS